MYICAIALCDITKGHFLFWGVKLWRRLSSFGDPSHSLSLTTGDVVAGRQIQCLQRLSRPPCTPTVHGLASSCKLDGTEPLARLHLAWLYKGRGTALHRGLHSVNGGVGGVVANSHLVVLKTPGMLLL